MCHVLNNYRRYCIFFIYIILPVFVSAQDDKIKFNYLTRSQGLSSSNVSCIFQDSKNYIWLGTEDGLNRYNGYDFTIFKNRVNDETSISGNAINYILEDRKHRIWIATSNGLNIYDSYTNKFTRFTHNPAAKGSISSNNVLTIFEDRNGGLWIGTDFGLNKYDEKQNNFRSYFWKSNTKSLEDHINAINEDESNNLYLGTEGAGVIRFDHKKQLYTQPKSNSLLKQLDGFRIITIKKDEQNLIWIGSNGNGLYILDPIKNTFQHFKREQHNNRSLSNNVVKSIIFDKQKNAWIGTENGGLNLKYKNSALFHRYENDLKQPQSFSSKTASCLLEDSQGNIWIGTHHGGVNIYSPKSTLFKNYTKGVWKGALAYNDIRGFIETETGEIWVGSDGGGINVFNQKSGTFTQKRYSASDQKSIGSDAIIDFLKDKKGNIWVCTWGGGLNRYNGKTQDFTRYLHDPSNKNSISSDYPYIIFEDSKGILWVGTFYGGLNSLDPKTGSFKRWVYSLDGKSKFTGVHVESIQEDRDGNLWFGTLDGGLNCLTADRKKIIHYFNFKDQKLSSANRIWSIYKDSKKRLWIGRVGLYLFDEKKKEFALYSNNPYLVDEQIQSIIEDKKGNLWMGTTNGLIQYHPDTKFFKRYTDADGLQGLEFCQNSAFMSSKGEMFFGGFDGFNTFFPDSIKSFDYRYPIYITDLSIFNKSISASKDKTTIGKYIADKRSVVLDYDQSVISVDYAALNYVSPKKTSYAYKLEGFDKDWNYVGNQSRATYTNLDPGSYTFYVKASTPEGSWNTTPAAVRITVKPPFYLTWWFKLIAFVTVGSTIFTILYLKRKQELRIIHEENKEKLHQLQLQFFTNISHEFRTPLTLIIGTLEQIFRLNENSVFVKHYNTINRNANRLLQLISELMDFRKAESGALKLKVMEGSFSSFIGDIVEDFKAQASLHHFSFELIQEKNFDYAFFDRQIVEKIILNVLNNSFKYTDDGGKINIRVTSTIKGFSPNFETGIKVENTYLGKDYLYIIVSDTGIGIPGNSLKHLFQPYFRVSDKHVGTGIGLAFVKTLVLLHKGTIQVYSEIDKGTQIIIGIPSGKKDYQNDELWLYQNQDNGVQMELVPPGPEKVHTVATSARSAETKNGSRTKTCILIVDDNDELRIFFREILENLYYIIEAKDGLEGIKRAKEDSPALIISDVMMPLMDGIDFCKFVKDDFETSHIPFILLTAKDAVESRLQGVKSGADYYFSKPVNTEILLQTIKNQLNQQQKIKDRYLKDYQVEVRDLVHSAKDKEFMDRLLKIISDKLEEPELNIDYVSREVGVSKSKLYKKIKDITGQSSNEFIRTIRLKKAIEIMTNEDVSVTEVMYRVGISSNSYFTTAFKKEFGITPSKFQQQLDRKV